jgi:hypothetical protein
VIRGCNIVARAAIGAAQRINASDCRDQDGKNPGDTPHLFRSISLAEYAKGEAEEGHPI